MVNHDNICTFHPNAARAMPQFCIYVKSNSFLCLFIGYILIYVRYFLWHYPNTINVHKKTKNTIAAINFKAPSFLPRFDTAKKTCPQGSTEEAYAISANIPKRKPADGFAKRLLRIPDLLIKSSSASNNNPQRYFRNEMPVLSPFSSHRLFFVCVFLLFDDLRFPAAIGARSLHTKLFFILSYFTPECHPSAFLIIFNSFSPGFCAIAELQMRLRAASAPTTGSEHLISHALDKMLTSAELHGIQVGIANYLMSVVQDHRYRR